MQAPSSCQSTTNSLFPYHFRHSPPLLYGNHLKPADLAASLDGRPNPILEKSISCHWRRKTSLQPVANPCLGVAIFPNGSPVSNACRTAEPIQYAIGLPGIFLKSAAEARKIYFSMLALLAWLLLIVVLQILPLRRHTDLLPVVRDSLPIHTALDRLVIAVLP